MHEIFIYPIAVNWWRPESRRARAPLCRRVARAEREVDQIVSP